MALHFPLLCHEQHRRQVPHDMQVPGAGIIRKGSICWIPLFAYNRATWIEDPDKFVPERWCPGAPQAEALQRMHMPFFLGKRACIGQSLATMQIESTLVQLIRRYRFKLLSDPPIQCGFILSVPDNLTLQVEHRVSTCHMKMAQ